jgi:hypothetical protein
MVSFGGYGNLADFAKSRTCAGIHIPIPNKFGTSADVSGRRVVPSGVRHGRRRDVRVHLLLDARQAVMVDQLLIVARGAACQHRGCVGS